MTRTGSARLGRSVLGRHHVIIGALTAAAFLVLVGRLFALQVGQASGYDDVVTGNRTRTVVTEGPRGRILDAGGRELATSIPVLAVTLDWQDVVALPDEERMELWEEASTELAAAGIDIDIATLEQRYQNSVGRDLEPRVLAVDIDSSLWLVLGERNLPGIGVKQQHRRHYPFGTTAAHVIGHLGTVAGPEEAENLNAAAVPDVDSYQPGDVLGRSGIEQRFEAVLRGRSEVRRVEVDATGRVVRTIEVVQTARPGQDVALTLDLDVQLAAEEALVDGLDRAREAVPSCAECPPQRAAAGSIVAIQPSDGSVVAMASYPAYDPHLFAGGADTDLLTSVLGDEERPLLNRAIGGQYPPGSTFKPAVAYASVVSGFRAPEESWTDLGQHRLAGCRAIDEEGCLFRNAGGVAMGDLDLRSALARSSDTYFYSIGEGLWTRRGELGLSPIQDVASSWGIGSRTGLEIAGEASGALPEPDGDGWFAGDNVNLAVGQGDLLLTPLQLANMYATIAADGRRVTPRLLGGRQDGAGPAPASPKASVGGLEGAPYLDGPAHEAIEAGLRLSTRSGTAAAAFAGFPLDASPIAGKTGTAQVSGKADFSLFAGYALGADADLAVAVVLEEAGWGAVAAAPTARAVFEAALFNGADR